MADARYAVVETSTSLVVNFIVLDDSLEDSYISEDGTSIVKITDSTGDPTIAGTYNTSSQEFVKPRYAQ